MNGGQCRLFSPIASLRHCTPYWPFVFGREQQRRGGFAHLESPICHLGRYAAVPWEPGNPEANLIDVLSLISEYCRLRALIVVGHPHIYYLAQPHQTRKDLPFAGSAWTTGSLVLVCTWMLFMYDMRPRPCASTIPRGVRARGTLGSSHLALAFGGGGGGQGPSHYLSC